MSKIRNPKRKMVLSIYRIIRNEWQTCTKVNDLRNKVGLNPNDFYGIYINPMKQRGVLKKRKGGRITYGTEAGDLRDQVRKLAEVGLSKSHINYALSISNNNPVWASNVYEEGRSSMVRSLASKAFSMAMEGDTKVLLHLLQVADGESFNMSFNTAKLMQQKNVSIPLKVTVDGEDIIPADVIDASEDVVVSPPALKLVKNS